MALVVKSEHLREAAVTCEAAFSFLVDDFGYREADRRLESSGFSLRYLGVVLGVIVDWYPRDPLTVWLVRLMDGDFPARTMTIHPDSQLHHFDLEDLEAISGHRRTVGELQLYALPNDENARFLADNLRNFGADLLHGDLVRLPLLERRVKDRARAAVIARFGMERAVELGW
jgi:hypothetical protein